MIESKLRGGVCFLLAVISGTACATAEPADSTSAGLAAPPADPVVAEATDATRAAIGVDSWGVSPRADSVVVHGYDERNALVATFEYRVRKGTLAAVLDTATEHVKLRVEAPGSAGSSGGSGGPGTLGDVRVLEDSFAGSATAAKVLARIATDLRSQPAHGAAPVEGALGRSSLRPLNGSALTKSEPTTLVAACVSLMGSSAADGANAAASCTGGANAAACSQGISDTKRSEDSSKKCECTGDATAITEAEVEITPSSAAAGDEETARGYIGQALDALCIKDEAARTNWTNGYVTLIGRESSYNPNAVNTSDSNATGATAADGNPQNCSRGLAQCIPPTFAANHQPGTSNNVYDPVANIAASMNYAISQYGVARDGSDLPAKIQQANSSAGPSGY